MTANNGFLTQYDFATTMQNRLSDITDQTKRHRVLVNMMESKGNIKPPEGGAVIEWIVYMRNPKPKGYNRNGTPEYNTPDSLRTARLGWGAYQYGQKLDRVTVQVNKGVNQFINIVNQAVTEVEMSFTQRWPEYFWQDGDNPPDGEPEPIRGFYTWFSKYIANAGNAYQGYQGKVRLVSGSYAELPMDLGTDSSDWAGNDGSDTVQTTNAATGVTAGQKWWPYGHGDSAYDYWHPLLINTSTAKWGTNAAFDETYCESMLDFGIQFSKRNSQGNSGRINVIFSSTDPMLVIRRRFQSTYRTYAQILPGDPNGTPSNMEGRAYGTEIYVYNGCYLVDEFDVPNSQDLIGLNMDTLSYHPSHPYDEGRQSYMLMEPYFGEIQGGSGKLIGGFAVGQLRINSPRNSVLWSPFGD